VKELSKESSNLLTCEGVVKFLLFDVLAKQGSELSEMILEALLKCSQNPNMIQSEDDFKYSSKAAIINCAKNVIRQNFSSEMDEMEHDETFELFEDEMIEENPSLAARMQKSIASTLPPSKKANTFSELQKELKFYEATGVQTPNLTKLDNGLKTIQPTSTDNERTFSVAGNFSTKLRNSMKFPMFFLNIIFYKLHLAIKIRNKKNKNKNETMKKKFEQ
jgi:hypothetical protein